MKFFTGIVIVLLFPFLSHGQCPVINTAMINACAQPPSTSEGINEFVYFTTTSTTTAANYTLNYGVANPPTNAANYNTLSGANAIPQNGPGSLVSSNGCTITYVTSPSTVIPAGSGVILIPSNFDNTYDLTGICNGTTLYAILVDITAAPSNTWGPGGTFANNSGNNPRYLQITNGANDCTSNIVTYNGVGWPVNTDGNSVWWGGSTPSYQNNGCSAIKPPKPTVTPGTAAAICERNTTASLPFTTTGNPDEYNIVWDAAASAAGFVNITGAVLTASPLSISVPPTAGAATYFGSLTVINTTSSDTSLAQTFSITINEAPVITVQPSTTIQNVCQNGPVTALSVTATAGSGTITGYQWYITTNNNNTSGAAIPFATSSTYTPSSANLGTLYFYCRVTNSNGCTTTSNVSGALVVSPNISTPIASATQQPTCFIPTGTIVVTSPVGANIQYSIGSGYQASGTFAGLAPGTTYNVTAKNIVTGCTSNAKAVAIDPLPPGPAGLAASVTQQPTCASPTGTITVSAPLGANYQYSVANNIFQAGNIFSGLTNGTTYNVTVMDMTTGCVSNPLPVSVNTISGAPPRPTISVVQTDCNNPLGSITILSPFSTVYEYSIGGTYQTSVFFSSLPPATNWTVTVRDISTGCISAPLDTSMDVIPALPTPVINNPLITYCQNATATILNATATVSGASVLWYTNGTGPFNTAPTPVTTIPGTFKFYASQKLGNCESPVDSITVTINPTPALPNTAGNTTTYCENTTAAVLTATGTNLQWYTTATGGTPLIAAPTPSTGIAGTTTYYASQTINGCESGRSPVTITVNAVPAAPVVANPSQQYCQNSPAGILSATGTGLLWYNAPSGGTGTAVIPTISTATTGSQFYYVSQTVNGCESVRNIITVTVVAVPTPPVTAPVEYCLNSPATAVTANGIGLQWYSSLTSTTALPAAPTPPTTSVGIIKYYVSQLINTCESRRDSVVVTVKPISAAPAVNSPLEYCQNTVAPALTATGTNLLWYQTQTGGPAGLSTAPTPSTATPGTTFFFVTQNTNGCESNPRTAITVTVKLTSTAVSGFHYAKDTACLNGVNIVPVYDFGFTNGGVFSASPAGINIDPATGTINIASSVAGDYKVIYTYNTTGCVNGSTASDSISLRPNVPTNVVFSYASPICKDAAPVMPQTQANFTAGGTFSSGPGLSINSTTGEINVSASRPGNYQVSYNLPELGCRAATGRFSFVTITDTSSPITAFTYSSTDICLIAGAVNPTISKAAGFTTGGTFTATPAGLNINAVTGDINIGLSVAGTYKIKYSVPAVGCRFAKTDSVLFRLRNFGNPVTGFSYFSPVCKGDNNAIAVTVPDITPGGIFSSTAGLVVDPASGSIDLRQSLAGDYTVRYDVAAGVCNPAGFGTAPIKVLAQPEPPAVTSGVVCGEGDITLTATATGTISWYTEPEKINQIFAGNVFTAFANQTTAYYVTNTVGSCESEPVKANAIVNPVPAKPFIGRDTSICPNDRIVLNAGTYNNYLWQDGSTNRTYTVTNTGIYKVIVSTGIGCADSATVKITVLDNCDDIYFPNAFAPNGFNKSFGAAGSSIFAVSKYVLRIYNRYGEEVFATNNVTQKWDGNYKGRPALAGAYVFIATYSFRDNPKVQKGSVLLIR